MMDQNSNNRLDENAELMLKASNDDKEAFRHLHNRFAPSMKRFFVKRGADDNTAEDLAQKIFADLWEHRKSFRPESCFEAYLFSMARNTLYNEIRRSKKIAGPDSRKDLKCQADSNNTLSQPEAEAYFQELISALEAAKAKLTLKQRQALEISHDPDIDLQRTLEDLGWSRGAYQSLIKRVRKRMRELMVSFFWTIRIHRMKKSALMALKTAIVKKIEKLVKKSAHF